MKMKRRLTSNLPTSSAQRVDRYRCGEDSEEGVPPRKHAVLLSDLTEGGAVSRGFSARPRVPDTEDAGPTDTDGELERRIRQKKRESAIAFAMRAVSHAALTERRLREKLKRQDYSAEETEEALSYVKRFHYIDDARLAQHMLPSLAARLWGRYRICRYLLSRGFDEETVETLDFSEIDFPLFCARLIGKYPEQRRDAMLRAVRNAGYSSEDLHAARRLLSEEE